MLKHPWYVTLCLNTGITFQLPFTSENIPQHVRLDQPPAQTVLFLICWKLLAHRHGEYFILSLRRRSLCSTKKEKSFHFHIHVDLHVGGFVWSWDIRIFLLLMGCWKQTTRSAPACLPLKTPGKHSWKIDFCSGGAFTRALSSSPSYCTNHTSRPRRAVVGVGVGVCGGKRGVYACQGILRWCIKWLWEHYAFSH